MENFPLFFATLPQGFIAMDLRPDKPLQMIAVDDIGAIATVAFTDPDTFVGRTLAIAGDELTMPQVAEILTSLLARPIAYRDTPQLWAGESFIDREFKTMFTWYNTAGYQADIPAVRLLYPQMHTLDGWLHETGWGQHMA
jgi:uncharacterized protein YbjT (DUF2867 family)